MSLGSSKLNKNNRFHYSMPLQGDTIIIPYNGQISEHPAPQMAASVFIPYLWECKQIL